ncbi:MAG TPA: TonB-dependent receptor [Methylibium sp.]|nr:TonB-dependent receptor [Methylibium sp.]
MRKSIGTRGAAMAAALHAVAAVAHAQQGEAPPAPQSLEVVKITAQKREQPLQDVPVSVTVMGGEALERARIDTGTEIARQTPNLRVSMLGDESQPKFSLRGISTPEFNLNAISPTGIFFDEVYVGASFLGGAQLFDIERVEVLRGPQGTLFGKNTTAGAINFISKRPTFRREGEISVGFGSDGFREAKGAIELPLVDDKLTARLAFTGARSDGYIENLNPAGRDLSSIDRKAARLTLGYKDDPGGLDATLRLFTVHGNPRAIGAINEGTSDGVTPNPATGLVTPAGTNAFGINPRVNPFTGAPLSRQQVATDRSGKIEVRGDGGYLTINKDVGFGTLTSITSYLDGRFLNLVDGDGTVAPLLHIDFASKTKEFSQDLRLASALDGPFQFIVGVYHQRDDIDVNTDYLLFAGGAALAQSYAQERRSYAAYLDGSYDVSKTVQAYGGLRYTRDKGRMSDFQVVPAIPLQGDQEYSDGSPTGRLGLSVKLTPDVMVYGQYARGYRSSAINGGALTNPADLNVADPEKLDGVEVGVKSQMLDRKLTLNVSAFRYDFKNQQFLNVVGIGTQQLVNAGQSRIQGLEVEAFLRPLPGLGFNLGLGLLDGKYRELLLNGTDLSGNRMIEAPKYTANLAADYSVPVGGYSLSFHADATFVDEQFFLASNSPESRVGSSRDVGARIALRDPSGRYELAVYGKNLTDNQVSTGVAIDPTTQTKFTTVPYPRRFGVELSAKF